MDWSPGSDDWIVEAESRRRDEALAEWHGTHDDPHDWPECHDCNELMEED